MESVSQIQKDNSKVFNTFLKPSSKESVLIWHTSTDPIQNQKYVENCIFDLNEGKKLNLFETDKWLFFNVNECLW